MCACVCVRVRACACVCVRVRERDREKWAKTDFSKKIGWNATKNIFIEMSVLQKWRYFVHEIFLPRVTSFDRKSFLRKYFNRNKTCFYFILVLTRILGASLIMSDTLGWVSGGGETKCQMTFFLLINPDFKAFGSEES